jgi:hypothetical protein
MSWIWILFASAATCVFGGTMAILTNHRGWAAVAYTALAVTVGYYALNQW